MSGRDKTNKYYDKYYARGFLLSREQYEVHDFWEDVKIGSYYLTYDPANNLNYVLDDKKFLIILGMVTDLKAVSMNGEHIASTLMGELSKSRDSLLKYSDYLGGRFVIIYGYFEEDDCFVFQDAGGLRSAYYATESSLVASHYNIIHEIIGTPEHPYFSQYKRLERKPWLLPGNITPWKGIKALFANHELSVEAQKIRRFWPTKPHEHLSINDSYEEIHSLLSKQVELLASNHKIMISFTGGNDSKITASFFRKYDDVIYFTYHSDNDPLIQRDSRKTKILAEKYGLNLIELDLDSIDSQDDDYVQLRDIADHNHYHRHVNKAIPLYLSNLPGERLHIRSVMTEITRKSTLYKRVPVRATCKEIINMLYFKDERNPEVISAFEEYYEESQLDNIHNYHTNDIVYWEYGMSFWQGGAAHIGPDMAFDTFQPFNCRRILDLALSSPRYFKIENSIVEYLIRMESPEMSFYLPNSENTLLDYFIPDKSKLKLDQCKSFTSSSDSQDCYYDQRVNGFVLGFGKSYVKPGDYVQSTFDIPVKKGKKYHLQLEILVPSECEFTANVSKYMIIISGKCYYETHTLDFVDVMNVVDIIYQSDSDATVPVSIRIESKKEYESQNGNPGLIKVTGIRIKQYDGSKKSGAVFTSKSTMFNNLSSTLDSENDRI